MQNDPHKKPSAKPSASDCEDKTVVYQQPFSANPQDKTIVYKQSAKNFDANSTHPLSETRQRELNNAHIFGNYRILSKIGQGGMGVVYKAQDLRLSRIVAIKLISKNALQEKEIQRFLTEAKANAQLQHPGIVRLLDVGQKPQNYLTMEYIEGVTLKELIYQRQMTPANSVHILIQLAEALQYAHDMGIIHRDIKPENIMITRNAVAKIMDFGLAKIVDSNTQISQTGDIVGTPAYMSPEQVNGATVTAKTDIYSLGATLYEILTLRPMFEGKNRVNIWYKILKDDPIWPRQLNADISSDLEAICIKCLQKNPEKRYKSMQELANDLRNFQQQKPIIAKSPTVVTHVHKFIMRHLAVSIMVMTILLSIVTGGVFSYYQWQIAKEQRRIAEYEKKEKAQEARNSKIRLAKIALTKCAESYKNGNWPQSGIFSGVALECIKNYSGTDIENIRSHAQAWLKQSIHQHGVLWVNQKNSVGFSQINYSQDGRYVVTCSGKMIRVWDSTSGIVICEYAAKEQVLCVDFSGDDRKIIWSTAQRIVVMDSALKSRLYEKQVAELKNLCVHPQKEMVAFVARKQVHLMDLTNNQATQMGKKYRWISGVQFSKDGNFLGVASTKGIQVWNLKDNTQREFISRRNSITSFSFDDDGKRIIAVYDYKIIRLWYLETDTYQDLFSIEDAKKVLIHAASNSVVVAYKDKLALWSFNTKKFVHEYKNHCDIVSDFVIPSQQDNVISVAEDGSICCWKLRKKRFMKKATDITIAYLRFNSNDDKIAAHIPHKQSIKVWDTNSENLIQSWTVNELDTPWTWISASQIAIAQQSELCIYDIHSGKNIRTITLPEKNAIQFIYTNTQDKILTLARSGALYLWDLKTGKQLEKRQIQNGVICGVWSKDGQYLACSRRGNIEIIDLKSKEKKTITASSGWSQALAFSDDGKFLATGFVNGSTKIWDMHNLQCIQTITYESFSNELKFLPANRLLSISAHGELIIWDTKSGIPLVIFPAAGATLSNSEQSVALIQGNNLVIWDLYNKITLGKHFVKWSTKFINAYSMTQQQNFFDFRRDLPGCIIEQALKDRPLVLCQHLFRQQVTEEFSAKDWDELYE